MEVCMATEQMIMSYFFSEEQLQAAVKALADVGLKDAHTRKVSRFGISNDRTQDNALTRAETLSGLVLYSANTSKEENEAERVLLAADPTVSGFSTSGNPMPGPVYSLTVFALPQRVEEAVAIIKQNGGDT
jgi:delta-aminolevulinic acid dehydratase/porphobilinogen synthase